MRGRTAERIETAFDHVAAGALAGAVAFAVVKFLQTALPPSQLIFLAGASAPLCYLICARALRALPSARGTFVLPAFDLPAIEFKEFDELLLTEQAELILTDADRLQPIQAAPDELVLDDVLAAIAPESRVVQLFDPAAMPTPAELNHRIEAHLRDAAGASDASQALHQALAELRRSLR